MALYRTIVGKILTEVATLQVSKLELPNPPVLGHVHRVFWWPLAIVNAPLSTLTFSE
jgi:hypothetical protein